MSPHSHSPENINLNLCINLPYVLSFYFKVSIFQTKYQVEYQMTYALFHKYDNCDDDDNVNNYTSITYWVLKGHPLSILYALFILTCPSNSKSIPIFWMLKLRIKSLNILLKVINSILKLIDGNVGAET